MLAYSLYIVCNDVKHTQHVFNRGPMGVIMQAEKTLLIT